MNCPYKWSTISFILVFSFLIPTSFAEEKSSAEKAIERRQRVELMSYFMNDPKDASLPRTTLAIQSYNQAVQYFQRNEYELARQSLKESLRQYKQNALAYELLGDIDYYEQKLEDAKANYEIAYNLEPRPALKEKIEKIKSEAKVEKKLATYREQHFLIKYHNQEKKYEGFALREILRNAYGQVSRDFGYYFKHQVVVILYDENDFKNITQVPHWASGVYDGKIRMPINREGFEETELRALTAHEVTHAFIAGMSEGRAPAWINEGLAGYEQNKVQPIDLLIFNAAVKTNTLIPLDQLTAADPGLAAQDTLRVALFYQQSFQLANYLIGRYDMFTIKKLLAEFGKGKDSDEALREVMRISVARLEKEWKAKLPPVT